MNKSRYIIGIDLGTTNSAVAYIDTHGDGHGTDAAHKAGSDAGHTVYKIKTFLVPQLVDSGSVRELETLPSFLYMPTEYELKSEDYSLPWPSGGTSIVGDYARAKGARTPVNLVSSAKSWLCHGLVDRNAPILPWGRTEREGKISPVEASSMYLRHVVDAWNHSMAKGGKSNRLENSQVIITIPASFDEVARELTSEAIRMAGIKSFTMLEEPQSAFYAWIARHESDWQEEFAGDELVLVCDVGGGTTDFNLITVNETDGHPTFQRVAVGDHLMLGGDNMDLALAREAEAKMLAGRGKFDFSQWASLAHQCRAAKEELLSGIGTMPVPVTVLGSGRSVVGGALQSELSKEDAVRVILDGFFEKVDLSDEISKSRGSGFQEMGLPYVPDPAVTRHMSSFLRRHAASSRLPQVVDAMGGSGRHLRAVRPDVVLFNGGVFKSPEIKDRVVDVLNYWFEAPGWKIKVLEGERLDHAVAIGAAYYGGVLRGTGVKITGGTGKAYYIGVEIASHNGGKRLDDKLPDSRLSSNKLSPDKLNEPVTCVCVAPRGLEEGHELHIEKPEFSVLANNPVSFVLYSSSFRAGDNPGDVITDEKSAFVELPPIKTILQYGKKSMQATKLPVSLGIKLNEYGTLDVWCESKKTSHRWKLAFQLRSPVSEGREEKPQSPQDSARTIDEATVDAASDLLIKAFSPNDGGVNPDNVVKKLQDVLGLDRTLWPLPTIRKMWDSLITIRERRLATPKHEARWLNLAGFLLRPGFGHIADSARMKELWKIFSDGVRYFRDGQCRIEWWILWRRVSGGLQELNQEIFYKRLAPFLLVSKKKKESQKVPPAELVEMWMTIASLEQLSQDAKKDLGDNLIALLKKDKSAVKLLWALSRIGARFPFHGTVDRAVPKEIAQKWIIEITSMQWSKADDAAYAVTQLARMTGDRLRDVDDSVREHVLKWLSSLSNSGSSGSSLPKTVQYARQVREVVPPGWEDEKAVFGESLPTGLSLSEFSQ